MATSVAMVWGLRVWEVGNGVAERLPFGGAGVALALVCVWRRKKQGTAVSYVVHLETWRQFRPLTVPNGTLGKWSIGHTLILHLTTFGHHHHLIIPCIIIPRRRTPPRVCSKVLIFSALRSSAPFILVLPIRLVQTNLPFFLCEDNFWTTLRHRVLSHFITQRRLHTHTLSKLR